MALSGQELYIGAVPFLVKADKAKSFGPKAQPIPSSSPPHGTESVSLGIEVSSK